MLTALFLTLIVVAILLHYYLVERPRMRARQIEPELPPPVTPAEALKRVPSDAFLQPTLTWVRVLEDGGVLLGLHPLLVSLVGAPYRLELIPEGWVIGKGRPLLKIRRGARHLQLRSPVNGRIVEVNPNACMERGWTRPENAEECWVYRVEPEGVFWDIPAWLQGDEAVSWVKKLLTEVESFLVRAREGTGPEGARPLDCSPPEGVGGGGSEQHEGHALPVGALAELNDRDWRRFEERFLTPEGSRGAKEGGTTSSRFRWRRSR